MMVAQFSEYTKIHGIVEFKIVYCIICELYINKTFILETKAK